MTLHLMSESDSHMLESNEEELRRLATMSDDEIDTSDIPEIKDWSGAERGKFYRPDADH